MCSDEFHQHTSKWISDMHHQPIFVSAKIKYEAVVSHEINGGAEAGLNIGWSPPLSLGDDGEPGT
jgi:hypothetical protein